MGLATQLAFGPGESASDKARAGRVLLEIACDAAYSTEIEWSAGGNSWSKLQYASNNETVVISDTSDSKGVWVPGGVNYRLNVLTYTADNPITMTSYRTDSQF